MRTKNISRAAWLGPVLVGIAYYLGAKAAFLIGTLSDKIFAPFWPPNAILFCVLALVPFPRWPFYILAALPAHVIAEATVGMGCAQMAVAFVTNCMVTVSSALALRHVLGPPPWFNSLHRAFVYVLIAVIAGPSIAAFGGAFVRILGGGDYAHYWLYWAEWYVANALGNLTLAVLLLAWMTQQMEWMELGSWQRGAEGLLLLIGLGVACTIAFRANAITKQCYLPAILYLPLPFMLWATVRFRVTGASAAILVMTVTSLSSLLRGPNIFDSDDGEAHIRAIQLFLVAISAPTLLLSASVDELRQASQKTARLSQYLLGTHDDERRQVARRLLDDICQRLAAATWLSGKQAKDTALEQKVKESIKDIREISYLLHPALLDEAGLEVALRSQVKDYSRCTGIDVDLEASKVGRLPPDVELTIFRVIEEALTNVKQHSGSSTARVSVRTSGKDGVVAEVEDAGSGLSWMTSLGAILMRTRASIPPSGLGLARMNERLQRLGGRLEIISQNRRTLVRAIVPMAAGERLARHDHT
jgi:signal transduction histidine kinase